MTKNIQVKLVQQKYEMHEITYNNTDVIMKLVGECLEAIGNPKVINIASELKKKGRAK